jgi:hypothetical protein
VALKPFVPGPGICSPVVTEPYRRRPGDAVHRTLRIYTQDPGASIYDAPVATARVPWEPLTAGPCGALFVVRDYNETRGETYAPVDLDSYEVTSHQGLTPCTSDPRFAQQMVYAVAMTVFDRFRLALGRVPEFSPVEGATEGRRQLVIRPHAFNEDNAYYDSEASELQFGYVFARADAAGRLQKGAVVHTALSHDVVVHEVSHALLDGMRPLLLLPSNPDVAAFHEGFSDLVALLIRFQYRALVERALEDEAGLGSRMLTDIARQWGRSDGDGRAPLRRIILEAGDPEEPVEKQNRYDPRKEEHDLGAVLVAAVFEAMSRIFNRKTRHIRRLAATPQAPRADVVPLLASQAQKVAADFLNILIRAVDYCPPVDITFGEFLRAMITADMVTVPEDLVGYREALVLAFRRYGVRVEGVPDLSEESLIWRGPERPLRPVEGLAFRDLRHTYEPGWQTTRAERQRRADALGAYVTDGRHPYFGIVEPGTRDGDEIEPPVIQSIRSLRRLTSERELDFHIVAEITQRRRKGRRGRWFYGGSTVVLDEDGQIRYVIGKGVMNAGRETRTDAFWQTAPTVYGRAFTDAPGAKRAILKRLHRRA